MKKMVQRKLGSLMIIVMAVSLMLNYYVQIRVAQRDMRASSQELFWQIGQILTQNQIETRQVTDDFASQCLLKAKAAAYIVQNSPWILEEQSEIDKVAELLQIDELHIFDEEGNLFTGSEPKYFGYTFDSGEQMRFFLPMLKDHSLELCQEITPNTAEGKLMQYAAVWREDQEGIVQIGMEPARVLEVTKKNELSYIFSLLTSDKGYSLYAIDPETYDILGSTSSGLNGGNAVAMGLDPRQLSADSEGFHETVNGSYSYCVFEESNGVILGRIIPAQLLYRNVNEDSMLLALYLIVISVILIYAILKYLDRRIITGISSVNGKLQRITNGDLDEMVDVHTTPEFTELSSYINSMVKSLLKSTATLSSVLDMVQSPMGVYEYSEEEEGVRYTNQVPDILALSSEEKEEVLSHYRLFEVRLDQIRKHPAEGEESVFALTNGSIRYVRIESFIKEGNVLGILMDVTKDIVEKRRIEQERDEDLLTGLYSRRAFYACLETAFVSPERLGLGVLIMIDADNLKSVNDIYGHENGDRYLCGVADILRSCTAEHQMTARLSGDEFAVFIYGCSSREQLEGHIEEIRRTRQNYMVAVTSGQQLPVHFSMGCAFCPDEGGNFHRLLKLADERMYQEKRTHKEVL